MSSQLAVYDHARDALAAAVRFDEVTQLRTDALKAEAYARIAKDRKLQADAAEIVARAERKLGIMLRKAKGQGQLSQGGRPSHSNLDELETGEDGEPVFDSTTFTLADIGVDKKLSSRAQKAAALDDAAFEEAVEVRRGKILSTDAPVVSAPKAKVVKVEKPAPILALEPRRFHQFAFSVLALSMASNRVGSESIHFLARQCGIVEGEADEMDWTLRAEAAMGSLIVAALSAIDEQKNIPEGSGTAREASGGQPLPSDGDIGGLEQGTQSAPHAYSNDDRYVGAVAIVRETGKVSASLISRRLAIGYSTATFLIGVMELDGIVSAPDADDVRTVLPATANEAPVVVGDSVTARRSPQASLSNSHSAEDMSGKRDGAAQSASAVSDFSDKAQLRETYEGEVALLAPHKGKLNWQQAEAAMRAGYAAEVPLLIMVEDLGHPHGTIATWANRLGLTKTSRMHATQKRFGGDA